MIIFILLLVVFITILTACLHIFGPIMPKKQIKISECQFKSGDLILFSKVNGIISGVSKMYINSKYTHVAIVIMKEDVPYIWEVSLGGANFEKLLDKLGRYTGQASLLSLNKEVDSEKLLKSVEKYSKTEYNYWRFVPGMEMRDLTKMTCTQMIGQTMYEAGMLQCDAGVKKLMPNHFLDPNRVLNLKAEYRYGEEQLLMNG